MRYLLMSMLGLFAVSAQATPLLVSNGVYSLSVVRDCRSVGNTTATPDRCREDDTSTFGHTIQEWVELSRPGQLTATSAVSNSLGISGGNVTGASVTLDPGGVAVPELHQAAFTSAPYARASGNLSAIQGYAWTGAGDSHRSLDINLSYTGTDIHNFVDFALSDPGGSAAMLRATITIFSLGTTGFVAEDDLAAAGSSGACYFDLGIVDCLQSTRADFELLNQVVLDAVPTADELTAHLDFDLVAGRQFFVSMTTQAIARFGAYLDASHTLTARFDNTEGLVAAAEGAVAVPAPNVLMLLVVGLPLLSLGRRVRD